MARDLKIAKKLGATPLGAIRIAAAGTAIGTPAIPVIAGVNVA